MTVKRDTLFILRAPFEDLTKAPADALMAGSTPFIAEPKAICRYLAATYGGAGPHP